MQSNKRPRLLHDDGQPSVNENDIKPRMTRACAECKRSKIRCETKPGDVSCTKCKRAGITCVPYNFAQKFMDEDAIWKAEATSNIENLQSAVQLLLHKAHLPNLDELVNGTPPMSENRPSSQRTPGANHSISPNVLVAESPSLRIDKDSDLVTAPMNNLYSLTGLQNPQPTDTVECKEQAPDFIDTNVVSLVEASKLFDHYRENINPLLWAGVLCSHQDLSKARESSTLLTAAIVTVAALHFPGQQDTLQAAYGAFVALVNDACLTRAANLDDVRALCIGAFYLTNLSWRLCSQAVRMATELDLHRATLQRLKTNLESYERLRLWYVIYVCDHQFAIAYSRPPLMHDDVAIRNVDRFLDSNMATNGDLRLVAQVNVFRSLVEAYFLYGHDPSLELHDSDFEKLRALNLMIDQWRLSFQSKSEDMPKYGTYPSKGTILYYHFARFQLNSLAFRGVMTEGDFPQQLSWDRREAANAAIQAATSTLKLIIEEEDLHKALIGVPIFTHSMIAMCASFLLKMAVAFGKPLSETLVRVPQDLSKYDLSFHTAEMLSLVENFTGVLVRTTEHVSYHHLANHILAGLKELLGRFTVTEDGRGYVFSRIDRPRTLNFPNSSLMLSRPISRNANNGAAISDGEQANVSNSRPPFASNQPVNIDFANLADLQDASYTLGNFDWGFDDNLLWNIDERNV